MILAILKILSKTLWIFIKVINFNMRATSRYKMNEKFVKSMKKNSRSN